MTSDEDDEDDDAAEAGPSKEVLSSRKRTPEQHEKNTHVATKKARSDVQSQPQQATPPRRLSAVSLVPPLQILDTPPRRQPHSPHLDYSRTGTSIPTQHQQHSDMDETIILQMQPVIVGNSPPAPLQRIMEEQHRQQQSYINILENNQMINESITRILESQNAATRELNATLTKLNETLRSQHQQQPSSSSGTTTPIISPVSSPPRRSTRARQHDSGKGKGQSKQPPKKT
ncbi:uncharacterized protein LOC134945060 [Pseudophryne corroboree]|uniref:uncharacterized protein LOC134945060 n=1 Tax=Pseudophryne corroboree TaxID=495146 RepID=UPI0030813ABC